MITCIKPSNEKHSITSAQRYLNRGLLKIFKFRLTKLSFMFDNILVIIEDFEHFHLS